jgi:hypothetical protein
MVLCNGLMQTGIGIHRAEGTVPSEETLTKPPYARIAALGMRLQDGNEAISMGNLSMTAK